MQMLHKNKACPNFTSYQIMVLPVSVHYRETCDKLKEYDTVRPDVPFGADVTVDGFWGHVSGCAFDGRCESVGVAITRHAIPQQTKISYL